MTAPSIPTRRLVVAALACAILNGCATRPTSPSERDAASETRAEQLPVFGPSTASRPPNVGERLGRVHSLSCHFRWTLEQEQSDAIAKLRLKALSKGADGVVGLRMSLITNPKSPCWHGYEASGLAVKFEAIESGLNSH